MNRVKYKSWRQDYGEEKAKGKNIWKESLKSIFENIIDNLKYLIFRLDLS